MKNVKNKSLKYHQAKVGILADGILSSTEVYDCICGLIIYYINTIKENKILPDINLYKIQQQKNYLSILQQIKRDNFQKIHSKDKKIFMTIFMTLELTQKPTVKRGKI